jgi:hypothetical protein
MRSEEMGLVEIRSKIDSVDDSGGRKRKRTATQDSSQKKDYRNLRDFFQRE